MPTISAAMPSKSSPVGIIHSEINKSIEFIESKDCNTFIANVAKINKIIPTKADWKKGDIQLSS